MSRVSIPTPRLLPITIVAMATLLVVKSGSIVLAASSASPPAAPASTSAPTPATSAPAATVPPRAEQAVGADDPKARKAAGTAPQWTLGPAPAKEIAAPLPPVVVSEPAVSESERTLLIDLRVRRTELDAREAVLSTRELALAAIEKRLNTRVAELTGLQNQLEALERQRRDRDETSWRGLVKLYETMKPRDAAAIFNDLDLPVLLPVLDRMKEAKAAMILSAMLPERARQVTTDLAQMRLKANSITPQGAQPAAGG